MRVKERARAIARVCTLRAPTDRSHPIALALALARCSALCCRVLQCVAVCCRVLQCVVVCCRVLSCVAVCCSVLPCVAVCCSVLQCVAVCCSVLQCASAGAVLRFPKNVHSMNESEIAPSNLGPDM